MTDRITAARQESARAREKAQACTETRVKDEWLKVAQLWDQLAIEYRQFEQFKEQI